MATEKLVYPCPNCKQPITPKRPLISGVYKITCPHCKFQHQLRLDGQDKLGAAPAAPAAPAAAPAAPAPAAAPRGAGAPVPPPFGGIRVAGPGVAPAAAAPDASQPTKTETIVSKKMGKAKLTQLGSMFSFNKTYDLPLGDNIIGRPDSSQPSDISISGDDCISRRSIKITVGRDELKGYSYKLKVLKCTNPVMLNDQPLDLKYDEPYLNFGDIIKLGRTSLRLDPVK
ncbi:MAG: FHA domain-containing protein [Muribaculaceae bacterium]|nr:FHA domain-containing protein [Muribaculaceae bacterium]